MSTPEIHVGLDIGTTKVCVVVTAFDPSKNVTEVLGTGTAECDGLKRGVVTNINKTAEAIKSAIDKAEQQSGYKLARVVVGVSGEHVSTFTTRGIVTTRTSEISEEDVQRLHHELSQVHVTPDRRILHVIAQDYIIDGQDGISDPLGMSGRRLEANALVITASASAIENVYKCAERAGLHVDAVVLQSIASSQAVLDDAEREVGVALVDIGGGTTDLAIYKDNVLRSVSVIGLAGQRVTDDIVTVLGIRNNDAEQIKVDHGHAISDSILRDEHFQVPGVGGRRPTELSKTILCQVIEPRMEEIFEFVLQRIHDSGLAHQLAAGIVITGGCSDLRGADMLAQRTFR
ncbi:MAG: cell division protein FtsA, partial [Candidatus Kapabacteria bacterium]|nr:cell division protein FtsA [Candidatus Kapabacteria bacterium]